MLVFSLLLLSLVGALKLRAPLEVLYHKTSAVLEIFGAVKLSNMEGLCQLSLDFRPWNHYLDVTTSFHDIFSLEKQERFREIFQKNADCFRYFLGPQLHLTQATYGEMLRYDQLKNLQVLSLTPRLHFEQLNLSSTEDLLKRALTVEQIAFWDKSPTKEVVKVLKARHARFIKSKGPLIPLVMASADYLWPFIDEEVIKGVDSDAFLLGILSRQFSLALDQERIMDALLVLPRLKSMLSNRAAHLLWNIAPHLPRSPRLITAMIENQSLFLDRGDPLAELKELLPRLADSPYVSGMDILLEYGTFLLQRRRREEEIHAIIESITIPQMTWKPAHFMSISRFVKSIDLGDTARKKTLFSLFRTTLADQKFLELHGITNGRRFANYLPLSVVDMTASAWPLALDWLREILTSVPDSQKHSVFCHHASQIKLKAMGLVQDQKDSTFSIFDVHEALMTLEGINLIALLLFEAANNLPVTMLLNPSDWKYIFRRRDKAKFEVAALTEAVFDTDDFNQQQVERFLRYGRFGCAQH